tara:strand:- start:525 stop:779 length:255 start_codon:yes stop_codon:yes gene_type:complete
MTEAQTPTTKKLKSMLKMLQEAGVSKYKDAEVEIEFETRPSRIRPEATRAFDFADYDDTESTEGSGPVREMTDEEYLWWSADGT